MSKRHRFQTDDDTNIDNSLGKAKLFIDMMICSVSVSNACVGLPHARGGVGHR